ncbi:MAG TPA: glycosyltransferase family 4 protein [Candidatus Saccharimonadales bacterium]|nr:glycosyltransferase family 4 protein [Candidatus Saccharimonadales bacterium]
MKRVKVGFVLDDTLDSPDGVQQYVLTLGAWLAGQGHDVHYLVGQTSRTDIANVHALSRNIKVQFNGNRMSTPLPASRRRIRGLLAAEQFDVLHVQIPYSPFMAHKVIMAAPATTAVVGTFHIAPHSAMVRIANRLLAMALRRSLRRFDSIFSVSSAAAAFARSAYGIETSILPNVVRAEHFRTAQSLPELSGRPTIVFLGRLVPRKGCQVLLEAIRGLKDNPAFSSTQVIVCGKGPLRDQLESYVGQHGLREQVRFVGFVDDAAKARYLKSADIAVFPSTGGESFGIVLIEAMAAEHPVVLGADNEGYRTVLGAHPELLFARSSPLALQKALCDFLSDAVARRQALAWQQTAVRQYDVAMVGRRLVNRYEEVLRRARNMQ